MIDIVVPWVNPDDPQWIKLHKKYSSSKGDDSRRRTRDFKIFKYFFRSIEENCQWVRKVHLILQSPSQIPAWLNTTNTKLNIVYHNEFIPKEFLPTFNTFVIEGFIHNIKDLSETFILCNDDYIFANPTNVDDFFINNLPVDYPKMAKHLNANPIQNKVRTDKKLTFFQHILQTNQNIRTKITHKTGHYYNFHVTCPFVKSSIQTIWRDYGDILYNALKNSRFRREYNFNAWLYRYVYLDRNEYVKSDKLLTDFSFKELGVSHMSEIMSDLLTKKVICINDTATNINETLIAQQINKILSVKFPDKSTFEK